VNPAVGARVEIQTRKTVRSLLNGDGWWPGRVVDPALYGYEPPAGNVLVALDNDPDGDRELYEIPAGDPTMIREPT
jgi:hypothetical protein